MTENYEDNFDEEEFDELDYDWYDSEYCYECAGYGNDSYEDEEGNWVSACDECFNNPCRTDPWDE